MPLETRMVCDRLLESEEVLACNAYFGPYGMNFKTLIENQPEVVDDRHSLSFSHQHLPREIAQTFSRFGVVMLKEALPAPMLESCLDAFRSFVHSSTANRAESHARGGSWHSPWLVRCGNFYPAAAVISAVINSWTWDVVEELCQSSNIVVLLKFCTARHSIDQSLGLGAHQDAKVVAFQVPLSLWIPLQDIVPGENSGLGFVVRQPQEVLPTLPHNDVGADYVLNDPTRLWIPRYAAGDFTIHSRFSPHFTTGYGTLSDRFSIEIRPMPKYLAPPEHVDPAIYVARRGGIPVIVDVRSSTSIDAREFLASLKRSATVARSGVAGQHRLMNILAKLLRRVA
jgi:hypothetical protein